MLAIVIINYKMDELTISFVRDELSKVACAHKTVIVNNSATDESNALLCEALDACLVGSGEAEFDIDKDVFVLPATENLGFAKGNNLGAEFCRKWFKPGYILFTNNDIRLLDTNVVEALADKMDEVQDAGVIGPRILGLDGVEQSPYPYRSFWNKEVWMYWSTPFYSKEKKIRKFQLDYAKWAQEGFHYYVMGSFLMVRAEDFFNCGMFDPNTFLYAEEPILSERMAAVGKGIYYYPEVSVLHIHGGTISKTAARKSRDWQFKSDCYYYKTYRNTGWLMLLLGKLTHALVKLAKR